MTGLFHHAIPFVSLAVLFATSANAVAAPPDAAAVEFFEKKVRPVLVEQCLGCHGEAGKKVKGGLKLNSRADLLTGGESGPAIVPGDPKKSLLVAAVHYDGEVKMPPRGKLKPDEVAALERWVKDGAAWPDTPAAATTAPARNGQLFTDAQKQFWAFQPVREPALPAAQGPTGAARNPIDAFILAKVQAAGLLPAAPADRRALIRRVTYDLTGLPPTPEEIAAFLGDSSPEAFARVVDRLLASPAYGERWARHWLDVARYADSNGLDENTAFGNAWRYRDYVIRSFNADKPYDLFVKEQLAGDLLPPTDDQAVAADRLIATGFLVLGPKILAEPDKEKMVMDIVDEQIDVVSKTMLGLTIACARCHDHKFDPIPTRDYYGLAGIFKSTKAMATLSTVARANERPLARPEDVAKLKAHEQKVAAIDGVAKKVRAAQPTFAAVGGFGAARGVAAAADKQVAAIKAAAPPVAMALAVQDEAKIGDVKVHIRGNHLTLGEIAPRVFPRVIAGESQSPVSAKASGRLPFAEWVASPTNPLTARVIVNRVWLHHFGEGLVRTPDNFGALGERPTHPELLDWLATRFVRDGWSLKKLHRLIVLSATYQQAVTPAPAKVNAASVDPDNRLLSHFNRRRLDAEAIRDSILAVAGTLDQTGGGSLLNSKNFDYVTNDQSGSRTQYNSLRRSIYLPVIRNNVFDFFQTFDFVEPHVPNGKRACTVVAPQALYLMNNPFVAEQARAFAGELLKGDSPDPDRVRAAYLRAFGRPASDSEVSRATEFIRAYEAALGASERDAAKRRARAWAGWCHVLFASSEFVYVD